MKKILLTLLVPLTLLTGCNSDSEKSELSRYTTSTFSAAGGMVVITQITDHKLNKIYYYEFKDKKGLVLMSSVDITKSGAHTLPFDAKDSDQSSESSQ